MSELDFTKMATAADFERYLAGTDDHSAFFDWMRRAGVAGPQTVRVVDPSDHTLQVTTVRLPRAWIDELDGYIHDREGRTGLIREAVGEWLERRRVA